MQAYQRSVGVFLGHTSSMRLEHWNSSQLRLCLFDSKTNRHGTYYSLLLQYYSLCGNPVVATAIVTTMLVGFMYVHCRWV